MTSVASAVAAYATVAVTPELGAQPSKSGRSRRTAFERDLLQVSRTNAIYFNVCFGVIVAALLGAGGITLRFLDSPQTIKTIFGVLGISISGLIALLASLWREKVRADLLLVLARSIDDEQLKSITNRLMSKL